MLAPYDYGSPLGAWPSRRVPGGSGPARPLATARSPTVGAQRGCREWRRRDARVPGPRATGLARRDRWSRYVRDAPPWRLHSASDSAGPARGRSAGSACHRSRSWHSRISRYAGRLPAWCPCPLRGGLEIQARFIFRQDHRSGRRLSNIDQFFSSCSSKVTTSTSRRDLNTFCVRW